MIKLVGHYIAACIRKLYFLFPDDSIYLRLVYIFEMGHWLSYSHPRRFTEKLQWLKIHDRKPQYIKMVDKIAVKEYVANIIGNQYIIPTLGIWDHFEDIDFDSLPRQFVLKTNHGSGSSGVVICKDKNSFDRENAMKLLEKGLKRNTYNKYREWPYKNVQPKIFAERMLSESPKDSFDAKDLTDYKFYCFSGEPKYCQVIQGRNTEETIDFFDSDWNHQKFIGLNPKAKNARVCPKRPKQLDSMLSIARNLSADIPFARVDLYEVQDELKFGEITFYPNSGFGRFTPSHYDIILGGMLKVTDEMGGDMHS